MNITMLNLPRAAVRPRAERSSLPRGVRGTGALVRICSRGCTRTVAARAGAELRSSAAEYSFREASFSVSSWLRLSMCLASPRPLPQGDENGENIVPIGAWTERDGFTGVFAIYGSENDLQLVAFSREVPRALATIVERRDPP